MRRSIREAAGARAHLISAGLMITAASVSLISACNSNPVEYLSSSGSIQKTLPRSASSQQKMDILWVVDNSGSMCQEQKFLGENFDKFINGLSETQLDFHLAVTTTHVPANTYPFEPIAKAGNIQSTPQPIPTFDVQCRGNAANNFQPVRDALKAAVACMATPDNSLNEWTNDQINCALRDTPNNTCAGVADRDGNGSISTEDLFPRFDEYRAIPKFLKSDDYRAQNGALDVERLRADFACMSLVGTRGTGYEKGLTAAILAVSPELTGLAPEDVGADATKPNHGFVRKDSGIAVIFVTDENDCSNDGTIKETANTCGAESCDYWNSPDVADQSPLLKPEVFKTDFLAALNETKGREVADSEIIMAGIFGQWRQFEGDYPTCGADQAADEARKATLTACADATLGESRSGDRYQRAIRQFLQYFPNNASKDDPLDFSKRDTGWMCQGDFSPALTAIGQFIGQNQGGCIQDQIYPCETDLDCPTAAYGEPVAGKCLPFGEQTAMNDKKFCDTGVMITIERNREQNASVDDINSQEYCLAGTIGVLPGKGSAKKAEACVVDPARYEWISCPAGSGVALKWKEADTLVATKLAGYDINQVFNVTTASEEDQSAQ